MTLAYETWGTLADDGSNAVLVLHALTGDSHVTGPAGDGHRTAGWWDALIGEGRAIDTDRWFVVAANVLGGCQGSTGPASLAADGNALGLTVPAHHRRRPGRSRGRAWLTASASIAGPAVIGGSMGGMRAIEWSVRHPDRVGSALFLAVGRSRLRRPDRYSEHADRCHHQLIPRGAAATTTTPAPETGRRRVSASPAGSRTSPIAAASSSRPGSASSPQDGEDPLRRRSLRGAVLPRPPRDQAGPALRRRQLCRADATR